MGSPTATAQNRTFLVLGVQRPRLVGVEVRISAHSRPGVEGVGQRPALAVERGHVSMETGGKEEQDVGGAPRRSLLEGQRRHMAPHAKGPADCVGGPVQTQRGRDPPVQDAGRAGQTPSEPEPSEPEPLG